MEETPSAAFDDSRAIIFSVKLENCTSTAINLQKIELRLKNWWDSGEPDYNGQKACTSYINLTNLYSGMSNKERVADRLFTLYNKATFRESKVIRTCKDQRPARVLTPKAQSMHTSGAKEQSSDHIYKIGGV